MRRYFAGFAAKFFVFLLYLSLPILPLLATLVFGKLHFARHYRTSWKKMRVHIAAVAQGPARHFFQDVFGKVSQVPDTIAGVCVQCGNCCMNHQCAFLQDVDGTKFQCGIYHSPFRRLSNCGSFPLNRHDIERYACPSYFATTPATQPVGATARVINIRLAAD